jgi:hypothetical protein
LTGRMPASLGFIVSISIVSGCHAEEFLSDHPRGEKTP